MGRESRIDVLRDKLNYWKREMREALKAGEQGWALIAQSNITYFRNALGDEA